MPHDLGGMPVTFCIPKQHECSPQIRPNSAELKTGGAGTFCINNSAFANQPLHFRARLACHCVVSGCEWGRKVFE